jgi:hypothetical protein
LLKFAHSPRAVAGDARLRTATWREQDGPAQFTFDQPSNQFASFGNPEITYALLTKG